MESKVTVKSYIPASLERALKRECDFCGCSISAVISDAILKKVRDMAHTRRLTELTLPGQLELGKDSE